MSDADDGFDLAEVARKHRERACAHHLERCDLAQRSGRDLQWDAGADRCERARELHGVIMTPDEARAYWRDREQTWCPFVQRMLEEDPETAFCGCDIWVYDEDVEAVLGLET